MTNSTPIAAGHTEAILRRFSKRRDKEGDWIDVTFQLHPHEVPEVLQLAGLGTRWMLAFAEIGDDDQLIEQRKEVMQREDRTGRVPGSDKSTEVGREVDRKGDVDAITGCADDQQWANVSSDDLREAIKPKGGRRAREAGMACKDAAFEEWARAKYRGARVLPIEEWVRGVCGVSSRADLDHDEEAGRDWDGLYACYLAETGRQAEDRS